MLIHGAKKLDADGTVTDFWLAFSGASIAATGTGDSWQALDPSILESGRIDAAGRWLTPGFIDLHGHGGGGASFDDGPEAFPLALEAHRAHGTTRSVLSLVANPIPALCASLASIAELTATDPLVLGSHLEGPFLAGERRGAHNPAFLRSPDPAAIEALLEASAGTLRQITIAPELPGALDAIAAFVTAGVVVAVGHTTADLDITKRAFDRGATVLTHAFNAMADIRHREPGPVVAALDDPRVTIELILDGVHVHPGVARMVFRSAPERIALITDAMAAAGASDGSYRLGSLDVTVGGGTAVLAGTDTIAGSTLTLDTALRIAVKVALIDPVLAIRALTVTPARALGLHDRLGLLRPGFAADAVLLDEKWAVDGVFADGRRLS